MDHTDVPITIIKDKFYFLISNTPPSKIANAFYFSIDDDLEYEPFYEDFGPLNLAKIWKYTTEVSKILSDDKSKENKYFHLTSSDYKKHTNAVLLVCAFQMLILRKTAQESYEPFCKIKFKPFRDAGYGQCTYQCAIIQCLRGLQYGLKLGWFDFKKFDIKQYEHYERVENGDLNWIIPNKFVAFSSPSDEKFDKYGNPLYSPKDYLPIFKQLGVTAVIRLNTKTYNAKGFTDEGIKHYDMFFKDGTSPPMEIVEEFLKVVESNDVFAVHCKAGLGRTGTLIGCYAMKHYKFNAADFIGWIRLCRPGSILGPQQYFMLEKQVEMKDLGKNSPIWKQVQQKLSQQQALKQLKNVTFKEHQMNEREKEIKSQGEKGQGEKLMAAKNHFKAGMKK